MSKKLTLFALVAVLVMAFTGSAFAATLATTYTWRGQDGNGSGNFDSPANWDQNAVPAASTDLAVFPATTKEVAINNNALVGAIRIDNGANATFTIANTKELQIHGSLVTATGAVNIDGIETYGDVLIKGQGVVRFMDVNAPVAPETAAFVIRTRENTNLEFNVRVESAADATAILKKDKGVVAFTAPQMNLFNAATAQFIIQDGEVQIARADHMNNANPATGNTLMVVYDTLNIPGRSVMLTSTWSGRDTFSTANKLRANTNGTLNVSVDGSTFVANTVASVISADTRTITKSGPGTLELGLEGVWQGAGSTLNMTEGFTVLDANNALQRDGVSVAIGADTKLTLNKTFWQVAQKTTGAGTLELLESSQYDINRDSTFPGYITGAGSLGIGTYGASQDITVYISGHENNYTGDTQVYLGAKLQVDHEKNIGGTKLGKLYLQPLGRLATPTSALQAPFARFELIDTSSFIIPNELYIGVGARNGGASELDTGGAVVIVPIDTRLEIANNITFNRNTLIKAGEGEAVFSSIGYDSQGDATFNTVAVAPNTHVTTALHIINGKARIENERALNLGDIVVGNGGFVATRPILSIRNGLKMTNSIEFTNQSTFQTELIDGNLSEGTNVASAVEVGKVFYSTDYVASPSSANVGTSGIVYNRVAFNDLSAGTVTKGNDFQLMKATSYTNYDAPKVEPYEWDGQVKAPFDPYFSLTYLYFKATHNIDVPTFGTPSLTAVKPGAGYTITIPVTSTTGLKAASETLFNLPGATVAISGSNLLITGNAPALAEGETTATYTYRVSVNTNGAVASDTLGYEGYKEYTLKIDPNAGGGTDPEKTTQDFIDGMSATEKAKLVDGVNFITSAGVVIGTQNWTSTSSSITGYVLDVDDNGNVTVVSTYNGQTIDAVLEDADGNVVKTVTATVTDGKATFSFTGLDTLENGTYTLKGKNLDGKDVAVTLKIEGGEVIGSSGSSGCDAGFGAFALLALGAAVVLRKKD